MRLRSRTDIDALGKQAIEREGLGLVAAHHAFENIACDTLSAFSPLTMKGLTLSKLPVVRLPQQAALRRIGIGIGQMRENPAARRARHAWRCRGGVRQRPEAGEPGTQGHCTETGDPDLRHAPVDSVYRDPIRMTSAQKRPNCVL